MAVVLIEKPLRLNELRKIKLANQYTTQFIMIVEEHKANSNWWYSNEHKYALPKEDCKILNLN